MCTASFRSKAMEYTLGLWGHTKFLNRMGERIIPFSPPVVTNFTTAPRFRAVTLRLFAARGFAPSQAKPASAARRLGFPFAPLHPRCSRRLRASALSRCEASATEIKPSDCAKTHPALRASLGFWLRSGLTLLLPASPRFRAVTL